MTHRHKPETRLVDITVTYPNVGKHSSSNTIGGRGTADKAAEEVDVDVMGTRGTTSAPAGTLVPGLRDVHLHAPLHCRPDWVRTGRPVIDDQQHRSMNSSDGGD